MLAKSLIENRFTFKMRRVAKGCSGAGDSQCGEAGKKLNCLRNLFYGSQAVEPEVPETGAVLGVGAGVAAGALAVASPGIEGVLVSAGAVLVPASDPASEAGALLLAA
jgi:hypothetical protein